MSKIIEKNRYMTLDGDIIGGSGWKNICLSYSFMTAVGTVCAINLLFPDDTQKERGSTILAGTLITAMLVTARKAIYSDSLCHVLYKGRLSNSSVIDTHPEQRPTEAQKKNSSIYMFHTVGISTIYLGAAAISPFVVFSEKPEILISKLHLLVATIFITPMLAETASMLYRAFKVAKGDWNIIDKNKMQSEPETAPSALMQPS